MKLIIATDNRFWRLQIGSQKRIASLYRHLVGSGHDVVVFFVGAMYPPDEQALPAFRPAITLRLDRPQPNGSSAATGAGEPLTLPRPNPAERVKAAIRRPLTLARAAARAAADVVRGRQPVRSYVKGVALRAREPTLGDLRSARAMAAFEALLRDFLPDAIIVEYVRLQYLAPAARRLTPGALLLVDTHDVLHERCARFHRAGELHEVDITPDEERRALDRFDVVLAIQEQDARKLRELTAARVVVAGYPHDVVAEPGRFPDDVRLVFGGADMAPNAAAAAELLTDVWPRINALQRRTIPLHLFGGVCAKLPAGGREGLHVHGFVDDLTTVLRPGDILLNLVRFGGGLKIKNVEALCHGMAVITTAVGAEGLEDGAGSVLLVVDSAGDAAAEADRLLRDPGRRGQLAAAAMAFAKARFSADVVYRELSAELARPA